MNASRPGIKSQPGRQCGVALALVVWFIAGMSLLVAGIVAHARMDTRMTQLHLARAKTVAAGDGAIYLALVERAAGYEAAGDGPLVSESSHKLGDTEVRVRIIPASGFIDLNSAPAPVLAALFTTAGGMESGEAKNLADNVIEWRNPPAGRRRGGRRLHSMEDLLRVEGVTRTLLDGIRDYAVAGDWTSGAMNWSAAPETVLAALEAANPAQADNMQRRRSALSQAAVGANQRRAASAGATYRADALVNYGGNTWLRRRWISVEGSRPSGSAWRAVRTEAPRVVAKG